MLRRLQCDNQHLMIKNRNRKDQNIQPKHQNLTTQLTVSAPKNFQSWPQNS